jgi:thiol-disulfide isomerase/thioredoxin
MTCTRWLFPVFMITLLAGCGRPGEKTADGTDITKVKLTELDGQPIDFSRYEGKVVFINFWATWCKPCIQEMPTIQRAQESLKNENVVFLMASNEDQEEIEAFAKRKGFQFHYARLDNLEALNIQALPTTFIFDKHGKLTFSEAGFRQWDAPENMSLITTIIADAKK